MTGLASAALLATGLLSCTTPAGEQSATTEGTRAGDATVPGPAPAAQPRRNVLLIVTDDQAVGDLKAMRNVRTRIRDQGTEFVRALSGYPLCSPARATLLTGRLAHNHHVLGNNRPWGGMTKFDDTRTLPVWLRRAGYQTGLIGKYFNDYLSEGHERYVAPGWTVWRVPVVGAYHYGDFTVNVNGRLRHYHRWQSRYVADQTVALLERFTAGSRPFFIWTNFLAPHAGGPRQADDPRNPRIGTPAVSGTHDNDLAGQRVPRTASLNEADMSDKSAFLRASQPLPLRQLDVAYRKRLRSLMDADDAIGRILTALRRTGKAGNTLVIFLSDNGFSLGQHRWFHKVLGYEESVRVPLLVRGPGFPAGVRRQQLVNLSDVTATILQATGATPTMTIDGVPLGPLARDPAARRDRAQLLEAGGWPYPKVDRLYTGIRTADDKVLLRWWNGFEEVYDLATDPFELHGEISPAEATYVGRLRTALDKLSACAGAACSAVDFRASKP